MSKKVFGIILSIASIAVMFIPGLGPIARAAIMIGITLVSSTLLGPSKPKAPQSDPRDPLYVTLEPRAPRKIALGITALETDLRYQSYTGSNQDTYNQVICNASHECQSQDEIWFDNEKAWTTAGGVQGRFVGYLTITTRPVGTSGNGVGIDGTWTSSCTLTGCAYFVANFKLSDISSSNRSPFASGVSNRVTVRGKGAKLYDPRLDSTVTGGSGSHRAATQSTWTWDDNACRNPALQLLFYLLGWKINGKLAVGMGLPPARIDLPSFITAANVCDELITLNGGGTEPRYRCDGIISEGDDRSAVLDTLCAQMNATLRDAGGKISLTVLKNDLAVPVASFTEADILDNEEWIQTPPLNQCFNIVRGSLIDPSDTALYQPVDFPEVSLTSPDGIDRIDTVDYRWVQSNGQAQRLAKQRLQRNQYQGRYSCTGGPRWWQVNVGQVVQLSHQGLGWSNKLFRLVAQTISRTGETKVALLEEDASIYAWANNEAAAVTPGTPTIYDPLNSPVLLGIVAAGTSAAPGDSNRVIFSLFEQGVTGFGLYDATASSIAAIDISTSGGLTRIHTTGSFSANGQECSIGTDGPTNSAFWIPVTAGERIFVGAQIGTTMPNSNCTCALVVIFYTSGGSVVSTVGVFSSNGSDSFPTDRGGYATVPTTAVYAQVRLHATNNSLGITGTFHLYMSQPLLCGAGATQNIRPPFTPGPSSEPGASVDANIAGASTVTVYATNAGAPKSLPSSLYKLMRLGSALTSGVTASGTLLSGNATFTTSVSSGILTLAITGPNDATFAVQSKIRLTMTYQGVTRTLDVVVDRLDDPPTVTGSSGSGGTTVNTTTLGNTTGTAYDTSNAVSAELTVHTGASGRIDVTAPLAFRRITSLTGSEGAFGKWQWRAIFGTYADMPTGEVASSNNSSIDTEGSEDYGALSVTDAKTGLTANTDYNVRFLWREGSGGKRLARVSGAMQAVGS